MSPTEVQVIIASITVIGSGLSAFVGIKVALAEIKKDIKHLTDGQKDNKDRIERLESHYFTQ